MAEGDKYLARGEAKKHCGNVMVRAEERVRGVGAGGDIIDRVELKVIIIHNKVIDSVIITFHCLHNLL